MDPRHGSLSSEPRIVQAHRWESDQAARDAEKVLEIMGCCVEKFAQENEVERGRGRGRGRGVRKKGKLEYMESRGRLP